jgi:hypothetical protein
VRSAFAEKFLGAQGGDFLRHRQIDQQVARTADFAVRVFCLAIIACVQYSIAAWKLPRTFLSDRCSIAAERLLRRVHGFDRFITGPKSERVVRTAGFAVRGSSLSTAGRWAVGGGHSVAGLMPSGPFQKSRGPQRRWSALLALGPVASQHPTIAIERSEKL